MKSYPVLMATLNGLPKTQCAISATDFDPVIPDRHGGMCWLKRKGATLAVIWSCDLDWDHVSVSLKSRTPNYQEMKTVKRLFFNADEWVVEYHPPDGQYISVHDNVLHLWRPHKAVLPTPPRIMV